MKTSGVVSFEKVSLNCLEISAEDGKVVAQIIADDDLTLEDYDNAKHIVTLWNRWETEPRGM